MDGSTEELGAHAEAHGVSAYVGARYGIPARPRTRQGELTVKDVFDPQACALHCRRLDGGRQRAPGVTWEIDPTYGSGTYWYHAIDDGCAICSFSMSFTVSETVSCPTPPFVCLGAYSRTMTPYFGLNDERAQTTVLGYAWDSPSYTQLLRPGGLLRATSIIMLPDAVKRMAPVLGCTSKELKRAICTEDGSLPAPELVAALAQAEAARPSTRTAQAYYTAKIVEALALMLDRMAAREDNQVRTPALSGADRTALARARQAIEENLDTVLPNATLCQLAYISESKLTRLFKRVEGTTPQEYARRLRMERARDLLEQSDLPLAEVARACGFKRQGSFSEAFRERYGCTPRAFRTARCAAGADGLPSSR